MNNRMIAVTNLKGTEVVISQEENGVLLRELDKDGEVVQTNWMPYKKIKPVVDLFFNYGYYEIVSFEYPKG